jgi:isochorismate synthase
MAMAPIPVDTSAGTDLDQILARLESGLSEARRRGRRLLVSVTIGIPNVDPLAVFAWGAELHQERRFWSAPNATRTIVGLGAAWSLEISGTNRFAVAADAWLSCCSDAVVETTTESAVSGPVLMAGFSFDPGRASTEIWADFPAGLLVLPRFTVTGVDRRSWLTINSMIDPDLDLMTLRKTIAPTSALLSNLNRSTDTPRANPLISSVDARPPEEWQSIVGDTTRFLQLGGAEKVVLAQSTRLTAQGPFDPTSALEKLRSDYPSCYVFAIDRGESCFLGASPEQLAQVEGDTVRTVCLAGSAPRGSTFEEDRSLGDALLASPKNRSEHAIVVRWVRDTLTEARIHLSPRVAPTLLRFQNVQHLYTPVEGRLPAGGTVLDLVAQLHPTPSVGGQPRETALSYLREHEELDRGWYAGAVGWVDALGQGEFTVAIRSALLRGNTAELFAGCGVVPESVPEQEYAEARMKLRPMLAALGATSR